MGKKLSVRASRASNFRSLTRRPERPPSVAPPSRVLWLVALAVVWTMAGYGGIAIGQVAGVDDASDMADSSGDIKRIEAWVDEGNLNLTMTVYGVFAPSVQDTPAGMTNRYYYHWLLDTDDNPATGYNNSEYEGSATGVKTPIGVDLVVQFGWRDGATNGVYAYDPLTEDSLFEDYEYTIDGDTIHAVIPLADLGLTPADIIALSAFQEGASNSWQVDWMESAVLPLTVTKATNPIPATDSSDITRDVILGWDSGASAAGHNVYLGTDWDDVNDATVPTAQDLEVNSFDPGRLDFGQTYYWRVDEVNSAPDFTVFKGDVWSFTVEPFAYPIEGIIATSNATSESGAGPENIVNGSGLDENDRHSTSASDMWLGVPDGADPIQVQFEFDRVYKVHEMVVWNYNTEFELILGFGLQNVTVEYSSDGVEWMSLGDVELAQATTRSDYAANTMVALGGVPARYVRLTVNSAYGMLAQYGLSEVRFLAIPAQAREPEPADEATEVGVDAALSWRAGREAASHEVYLDSDAQAVADGTPPMDTVTQSSYAPSDLQFGSPYYWKVVEVNDAEAIVSWEGPLWSFTTQEYAPADDFEAYDNEDNRIYDTWLDGWVNETGSTVGYLAEPFAETSIVHGGQQAMPLEYDNSASPFYSEASRTWASAQYWTVGGAVSLRLYFQGSADNTAAALYIAVEDSAGNVAVVTHPDPDAVLAATWQGWTIPFGTLTDAGVNPAAVKTISIGLGDRANPSAGGTGTLYVDDIGFGTPLAYHVKAAVTGPGDAVQGVPNDGDWPGAETPDLAIDDDTATKFLHFKGETEPTGLQVTPSVGATIVTELTLTTANDAVERDPVSFELYGSNEGLAGPYTLIASGDIVDFAGAEAWPRFTANVTPITFDNDVAYGHYQLLFPTVRDAAGANSMQIAEIELIGVLAP
jgi:F5/8 type C domain